MKVEREMKIPLKVQLVLIPFVAILAVVSIRLLSVTDLYLESIKTSATQMAHVYRTAIDQQSEIEAIQPKLLCSVFLKGTDVVAENSNGEIVSFVNHQGQIFGTTPDGEFYHVYNSDLSYFLINKKYLDLSRCPSAKFSVFDRWRFK